MKTTQQMIEDAKKFGVTITITTKPKGHGEVTPLPGVRLPTENEREAT